MGLDGRSQPLGAMPPTALQAVRWFFVYQYAVNDRQLKQAAPVPVFLW